MVAGFKIEDGVLTKYEGTDAVVVIPEGVLQIGENAFKDNKTLTEVTMPNSVVTVGKYAFYKCAKLKSVVFSESLRSIEYEAFAGCKALKEISLPDTLENVESGVFAGCVKLAKISFNAPVYKMGSDPFHAFQEAECKLLFDKDGFLVFGNVLYQYNGSGEVVAVPNGVTHIAAAVFRSGSFSWEKTFDFKKVILPESVKYVGNLAFANCKKLEEIVMPDGIEFGKLVFQGCTKLADENGLIIFGNTLHEYLGKDTEVVIPEGVEVLSDEVFLSGYSSNPVNNKITKVVLPQSLKHIGHSTFRGCASLREINLPDGLETIDIAAFYDCISLADIKIPNATVVHNQAFNNCKSLADENGFIILNDFLFQYIGTESEISVPENVKLIGTGAFSKMRIKKVTLPKGLRGIGAAFNGCEWLEEIDIPEGITDLPPNIFSSCHTLKKVRIPDSVVRIGKSAFEDCESLEEICIPQGAEKIGERAFENCKALKTIAFPGGVKNIPPYVCVSCASLETVLLSDGIETVENAAFESTAIKQVTLPQSVQSIGRLAFDNCQQLESLSILNPECDIDLTAFNNCPGLLDENGMKIIAGVLMEYTGNGGKVTVPDTVHTIAPNVFREGSEYAYRRYVSFRQEGSLQEVVIPGSVKTIGDSAFRNCSKLEKITLNDGLEKIGSRAFDSCEALKEIVLPPTVRYLGNGAFMDCKALASIEIPEKLEAISLNVFRNCAALTGIFVEPGNRKYADEDGILYSADKTALIFCPAGKKLRSFTVPDHVYSIEDNAFIDCDKLSKIVIPAGVKEIGNTVFARGHWSRAAALKDIQIAMGAGSVSVGEAVIDFPYGDAPLVYPNIPVTFPKELTTEVRLAMGFCQSPEKYTGEYAEEYRKYAQSHKKTLLKKAVQMKLADVEAYFSGAGEEKASGGGYKPNLTLKKANGLQKVEILEEVVLKGTLEDLKAVLKTYKSFEMTARALALASRYRGVDFVRVLAEHGASFRYESAPALQRKYTMEQKTAGGVYSTEYYLMLVPEKLDFAKKYGSFAYEYTPMYGVPYMNITDETEAEKLPLAARAEVAKYFAENESLGASLDEMLFWALTRGEIDFADALIDMGADLNTTPPAYYTSWDEVPVYADILTLGSQSVYWTSYITAMSRLAENMVLPVLKRFAALIKPTERKLAFTQKLFDSIKWSDGALEFAVENADLSKINQKTALECAVNMNGIASLNKMAAAGWIAQPAKREKLIDFARENNKHEALAWLLDFKNRTVDIAAEEAKAEAKIMRELTEDPDSVSALKKIWTYKKLEDGTLLISSYKGSATEVTVPAQIGKAKVTVIGEHAFAPEGLSRNPANSEARKKITSVVLPEGITEIESAAFYGCESLESVSLPSTLETIGSVAFRSCKALRSVEIPKGTKNIAHGVFWNCNKLYTGRFLIVNNILFHCSVMQEVIEIPEGVTYIAGLAFKGSGIGEHKLKKIVIPNTVEAIGREAFAATGLETLELPASVKHIDDMAFFNCKQLKEVRLNEGLIDIGVEAFSGTAIRNIIIPETVKKIGKEAFSACYALRDVSIPSGVKSIGERCFGWVSQNKFIHTEEGAYAVRFTEQHYPDFVVFYDLGSEDYRK